MNARRAAMVLYLSLSPFGASALCAPAPDDAFARGDFETAVRGYEKVLAEGDPGKVCHATIRLGDSYRLVQRPQRAMDYYRQALDSAETSGCRVAARTGLGIAQYLNGNLLAAGTTLEYAVSEARRDGDPVLLADALNAQAGVLAARTRFGEARQGFEEAAAMDGAGALATARARTGLAAMALVRGGGVDAELEQALVSLSSLPDSYLKGLTLLEIADIASPYRERAITAANAVARHLANAFLHSAALGRSATVALDAGDLARAGTMTQQALFQAQSIQNAELLYLWNWQMGRIQTRGASLDAAVTSYALAMDAFQLVRNELIRRYRFQQRDFRETFGSFFLEYAALLMQRDSQDSSRLQSARAVIETFKNAELQDYFLDDCVTTAEQSAILSAEPGVAVIYPIIHPDRLDILVETDAGLSYTSVPVGGRMLSARLGQFRRQLQSFQTGYRESGYALYEWLIAPISGYIAQSEILVIVPDGALRLIPFAALYDGERFLVQQYAIVVTPGLSVTASGTTSADPRIVLAGLTENVQGYAPLPGVAAEIAALGSLYGNSSEVLLNDRFDSEQLNSAVVDAPVSILHLASHAEFGGDRKDTFVLTYDGRLDLDELESLVRRSGGAGASLDLLTLAACQTAMGDDRAALGLAGVAVKAGAATALATLWSVADESAGELTVAFYSGLREGHSRARALRDAQLQLINSADYAHPGHWSAFLLIGDWH